MESYYWRLNGDGKRWLGGSGAIARQFPLTYIFNRGGGMNGGQVACMFLCMFLVCNSQSPYSVPLNPRKTSPLKSLPTWHACMCTRTLVSRLGAPASLCCVTSGHKITQSDIIRLRIYFEAKRQLVLTQPFMSQSVSPVTHNPYQQMWPKVTRVNAPWGQRWFDSTLQNMG